MSFLNQWRLGKAHKAARERGKSGGGALVTGIGWYTEEEWNHLTRIVPDRSELDDTYPEWVEQAEDALCMLRERGVDAKRVMVNVAELQAWCEERGRVADGAARADYVGFLLRKQNEGP